MLHPGHVIADRFVVDRFVASGGMGDVYRATDRHTGKPVAVKLLGTAHPSLTARLGLEARALLELEHPAIVRHVAHETEEARGLFLAMEWLDGVTLSERIRGQPLSVDEALVMAARVADGLGAAHAAGMVHRDIKPLNLFLPGGMVERVKILDFGIVRLGRYQQITGTGVGMGTPEYMAPEQARCDTNVGPAADIFALGCVLYKCLTGRTAFRGNRIDAVLAKIAMVEEPPRVVELVPEIPAAVDQLVARMMAYDPARRPRDGAAAARHIRAARDAVRAGVAPTSEVFAVPALTERELVPISVLFAELEVEQADTVPSEVFDVEALGDGAPRRPDSEPSAQTAEQSFERIRVIRGSSDAEKVLPAVRKALEPYGARVEVLLNGSLVALLSGGIAATDLAARAGRCALAIRELLPDASVGVATQRAVKDERAAIDPIIDGAAALVRVRSRAIHIDASTRDLLPARFEVTGDTTTGLELRGEHELGDSDELPRRLLGMDTPCVGRGRVLRQLEAAFEGCAEDRAGHAVVVVGEAGVGKSRLRAELMRRLRAAHPGLAVLAAFGDAVRTHVPFGLIASALRRRLALPDGDPADRRDALRAAVAETVGDDDRDRVAEFLGELLAVPFDDADSPALRAARQDPELMADQLVRAWQDWLAAACAEQPLLFVIDDLHWADQPSVELIAAGLRHTRELPLLVLALARPEVHDQFPRLADEWSRQEIPLETLRQTACEELVRAALGADADAGTTQRIVARSAGNPFYLEELIRAAAAGERDRLPESVLASVQMRIGRLPDQARQVLRAASIFGRTFWPGGVATLLGGDTTEDQVVEWLTALEWQEMVQRRPGGTSFAGQPEYLFRHDLLREAAYEMLTEADRRTGHRLAGQWLLDMGETEAIVLAEHFAGGGATDQAIDWFERAAEQALDETSEPDDAAALRKAASYYRRAGDMSARTFANDNAIAFFERAAALWTSLDAAEAVRALLDLADVRERIGHRRLALDDLAAAERLAAPDDPTTRVEILLRRANLEMRGEEQGALDRAKATAHEAHDLAVRSENRPLEARALAAIAQILTQFDSAEASDRAIRHAERAVALQQGTSELGRSLWLMGNAFLRRNEFDRAASLYEEALAFADASGDELLHANCRGNLAMLAFRRWQLTTAIDEAERALAQYRHIGHRTRVIEATLNVGTFYQVRGDVERARTMLGSALEESSDDWIISSLCRESLADLDRFEGAEQRAQEHLQAAAGICARASAPQKQAYYLGLLAESYWATGKIAAAVDALETAVDVGEGVTLSHALLMCAIGNFTDSAKWLDEFRRDEPDPDRRVAAQLTLARLRWWTGETAHARTLCDEAFELVAPTKITRFLLPAQTLAACLRGDVAEAVDSLRASEQQCGPPAFAEVALDVGTALVAAPAEDTARSLVTDYAALCSRIRDRRFLFRLLDLQSRLYERLQDAKRAVQCSRRAGAEIDGIRAALSGEHRDVFDQHPWVQEARRARLVP